MKLTKSILLVSILSSVLTTSAFGADIEAGIAQKDLTSSVPVFTGETTLSTFSSEDGSPLSQAEGLSFQESKSSASGDLSAARAAASGITYFEVGIVYPRILSWTG